MIDNTFIDILFKWIRNYYDNKLNITYKTNGACTTLSGSINNKYSGGNLDFDNFIYYYITAGPNSILAGLLPANLQFLFYNIPVGSLF